MAKKQYKEAEIEIVSVYEHNDVLSASANVDPTFEVYGWFKDAEGFGNEN